MILCSYRVLLILLHLLIRGKSHDMAPFMFSVAMFMFAFLALLTLCDAKFVSPGIGVRGCLQDLAWQGCVFFLPLRGCGVGGCHLVRQCGCS